MEEKILIEKVRQNDEQAFRTLLQSYEGIIYANISRLDLNYGEFKIDKQDLYQEACIALYNACLSYKEDMGCKFSTFSYLVIRRRLLTYYKKISGPLKNEIKSLETISDTFYLKTINNNPNISFESEKEYLRKDLKCIDNFIKTLSPSDKRIVNQKTTKKTYRDIASKLGVKPKVLYNRLAKIKKNYSKFKREKINSEDLNLLT